MKLFVKVYGKAGLNHKLLYWPNINSCYVNVSYVFCLGLYQERIDGYDDKIAEIEKKIGRSGEGIEKHLGELSTIRLESITKTIQTGGDEEENKEMETKESEDKPSNPQTGKKGGGAFSKLSILFFFINIHIWTCSR